MYPFVHFLYPQRDAIEELLLPSVGGLLEGIEDFGSQCTEHFCLFHEFNKFLF